MTTVISLDSVSMKLDDPVPFHFIPLGSNYGMKYGFSHNLIPWLIQNANSFDGVIINGIWQYHSFATRWALSKIRKPYVIFPHGMLDPWFNRTYPLKRLKKMLYWPWAEYRVLRDAAAVLFTCDEECRLARESFWPYKAREAVVGYGTLPPPPFSPGQIEAFFSACPTARGRRILLYLSRIHPKKGCDLLIPAFASVAKNRSDLHLVMAGPDENGLPQRLRSQAAGLGLTADRISWPGMLQGDAKWGSFRAADAFVLPSHQENFGIAVVESLACGTPVLITKQVQIWREIIAAGSGLAEDDSPAGITRLLATWLAHDRGEWEKRRGNATASFTAHFDLRRVNIRLLETMKAHGALRSDGQTSSFAKHP